MAASWDYIIICAGSSSWVMAERLNADGKSSTLILEAGCENGGFWVFQPKGVAKLVTNPSYVWMYKVDEPRKPSGLGEFWIRGKGFGKSFSVNGMIWSWGEPADYDAWEVAGCTKWKGPSMTDAFFALEDHASGGNGVRGAGGPVHVDPAICITPCATR